jgi:NAD(P)-dependent dehydrogenase (short-subunit alcohol dehydrogenase family)
MQFRMSFFNDVNFKTREWDIFPAYAQSKTANILFSVALTHLYSDKGIVSNALMPGNKYQYFNKKRL